MRIVKTTDSSQISSLCVVEAYPRSTPPIFHYRFHSCKKLLHGFDELNSFWRFLHQFDTFLQRTLALCFYFCTRSSKEFGVYRLFSHQENGGGHDDDDDGDQSKAIVLYNALTSEPSYVTHTQQAEEYHEYYEDHDKYPDLTHSLFDDQDDLDSGDPNESAIDMVRNSKEEGEEFKLEDEIDQVADLFIKKFHKRMRMQKLASFKRYQEMLERSA